MSEERLYITPNGFPGLHQKGDGQIADKLEKLYRADVERVGFDKADKRLRERVDQIVAWQERKP